MWTLGNVLLGLECFVAATATNSCIASKYNTQQCQKTYIAGNTLEQWHKKHNSFFINCLAINCAPHHSILETEFTTPTILSLFIRHNITEKIEVKVSNMWKGWIRKTATDNWSVLLSKLESDILDRLNVSKVLNVSLQQYLYHSALTRMASLAVYGRPWLKQTNVHSRTSICLQERASADNSDWQRSLLSALPRQTRTL